MPELARHVAECPTFPNLEAFYADDERRRFSPEWDYGVWWNDGVRRWPVYRLSWVIETGDLYAVSPDELILLGNVPRVGDYPWSGAMDAWTRFKEAQTIERLLDGWAEVAGPSLGWVLDRISQEVA